MCHEQWALTVIKRLRFFVLILAITAAAAAAANDAGESKLHDVNNLQSFVDDVIPSVTASRRASHKTPPAPPCNDGSVCIRQRRLNDKDGAGARRITDDASNRISPVVAPAATGKNAGNSSGIAARRLDNVVSVDVG